VTPARLGTVMMGGLYSRTRAREGQYVDTRHM
jgi:hypothetical protein